MQFDQFVSWAFQASLTGAVIYGVTLLGRMRDSIDELNIKVAVIIERTASHEKTLDFHNDRITKIEARGRLLETN